MDMKRLHICVGFFFIALAVICNLYNKITAILQGALKKTCKQLLVSGSNQLYIYIIISAATILYLRTAACGPTRSLWLQLSSPTAIGVTSV